MNDNVEIDLIAQQCAVLSDGIHIIRGNNRKISVEIVSLEDQGLCNTTLATSITCPVESKKTICYEEGRENCPNHTSFDFISLLKNIAAKFSVTWVEVEAETSCLITDFRNEEHLDHFLPIICFVQVGPLIRIVYHGFGSRSTVHDYSLFAFQNIPTNSKRFNLLIYQLVDLYNLFAHRNLFPIFSPHILEADTQLWLTAKLSTILTTNCFKCNICKCEQKKENPSELNLSRLYEITAAWTQRKISNYDYLITLNKFAGRVRHDPDHHPVLPWVVDFTSPTSGYRDLSRTKYRITKGDDQLHEQYQKGESAHHIPELLSDICYFSYRARIESKERLCRYVRSQWVPREYPGSMARIYEWSPDECIPEFYDDPSILRSIHSDLPDIQLPEWTSTPEEFIKWHREQLESDEVSQNLHHWIDLVFGYKLAGKSAVDALNVHLCFVRRSLAFRRSGVVQLFIKSHPQRQPNSDLKNIANNQTEYPVCDERFLSTNQVFSPIPPNDTFELMSLLKKIYNRHNRLEPYVETSVMSIGVTIVELCLPEYCRELSKEASFEDRLQRARTLISNHFSKFPRHIRKALSLLLKVDSGDTEGKFYRLSSSLSHFFSLPLIVVPTHNFLALYHSTDHLLHQALINDHESQAKEIFKAKIDIVWNGVEFKDFNPIWCNLFVEMLQETKFAVMTCNVLFGRIMEYVDDLAGTNELHDALIRLYEFNIPDIALLYDRRFLLQLCIRFGTAEFLVRYLPLIVQAILSHSSVLQEVSRESILWLAKRYGPIVASTQITPCIFRLLTLCYAETSQLSPEFQEISMDVKVAGDESCSLVIDCLVEIALIYGPAFITLHYLPYCADLIEQSHRRLTSQLESAAIAAMSLLITCCDCLSDRQLMDHLSDLIVDRVLFPAIRLFCTTKVTFSSDRIRRLFACKAVKALHLLACRVGAENVQRHMSSPVIRLFSTFNLLYDATEDNSVCLNSNAPEQLVSTFTPSFARLLLISFSCVCGRQYIANALPNAALIARVAALSIDDPSITAIPRNTSEVISSVIGTNASAIFSSSPANSSLVASVSESGNRLTMFQIGSETPEFSQEHLASSFDPSSDHQKMAQGNVEHLAGSWVDRFRSVLSATSDNFSFDQIPLVTFSGHSGLIRRICVLDNENSFLTGSHDKTVKLWSIRTTEESTVCQWTYQNHAKAVNDLVFLSSLSLVASADVNVHIWDPFKGSTVHQVEWPSQLSDMTVSGVQQITHHSVIAAAASDTIIRLVIFLVDYFRALDVRMAWWAQHYCTIGTAAQSGNGIRAMAVSPNSYNIVVGLNNGALSLIDTRTGKVLGVSILQHTDITQLEWIDENHFASVHSDHPLLIWQSFPRLKIERKLPETASLFARYSDDQFLTLQSNRLRIHRSWQCHTEVKLRSELISGSISAMETVRLNRMLLIGSSNGMIRLSC